MEFRRVLFRSAPLAADVPDLASAADCLSPPEGPLDVVSSWFSMRGEEDYPLLLGLRCGISRPATMDELREFLDEWPFGCEHTPPATHRKLFPGGDGTRTSVGEGKSGAGR